jgi:hypothetical protein
MAREFPDRHMALLPGWRSLVSDATIPLDFGLVGVGSLRHGRITANTFTDANTAHSPDGG